MSKSLKSDTLQFVPSFLMLSNISILSFKGDALILSTNLCACRLRGFSFKSKLSAVDSDAAAKTTSLLNCGILLWFLLLVLVKMKELLGTREDITLSRVLSSLPNLRIYTGGAAGCMTYRFAVWYMHDQSFTTSFFCMTSRLLLWTKRQLITNLVKSFRFLINGTLNKTIMISCSTR